MTGWFTEDFTLAELKTLRAKERLELELLGRSLPRVQLHEVSWNLVDGWLLFHNLSAAANERFRKLFFQTFGLKALPEAPLDRVLPVDPALADRLALTGGLDYRPEDRA